LKRIAIVGAGVAGLRAAMLLESQGHELAVFEARDRLGGRMCTEVHHGQAVYDSGGEWIDADHERVLSLLRELAVRTEIPSTAPRHFHFRGESCTEESLWPDALEHEIRLEAAAKELCRNLHLPAWDNWQAADLDSMSLATFIDTVSTTERGRWFLRARALSDEGDAPERIGLLGWLAGYMNYMDRVGGEMSAFRIEGGAAALLESMRAKITGPIQFDHTLLKVTRGDEITLSFTDFEHRCDEAILTLPPRALERVAFEPSLTPEKRCAVEACTMSPVTKIGMQFQTKWWLDEGWDGSMQCDLAIQQTWDASRGETPILTCYICGPDAQGFAKLADPVGEALSQLADLHPRAAAEFVAGCVHDWTADPFSGGGFSQTPPGFVLNHMRHMPGAEGHVHFAGEHTSPWLGFIEGALESAERVCAEINGHGNSL
jgi:monoamine oxidase